MRQQGGRQNIKNMQKGDELTFWLTIELIDRRTGSKVQLSLNVLSKRGLGVQGRRGEAAKAKWTEDSWNKRVERRA